MTSRTNGAPGFLIALLLWFVLVFAIGAAWAGSVWVTLFASAAIFAITAPVAFACLIRGVRPLWGWMHIPIIAAPLWGVLQIASKSSVDRFVTTVSVLKYGSIACAFILATYIFNDDRVSRIFWRLVVLLSTLLAIFAIVQLSTSEGKVYWFIETPPGATPMGPFVNRDNYSGFIALVLPMALFAAGRSTRSAWLNGLASALMYASVIAGGSRAGSILVTLEVLAVLIPAAVVRRNIRMSTLSRTLAAVALIALFSSAVGWSDLLARFDDKDPYGADRRDFVQSSLLMLKDRPGRGFGLGTWSIVYPRYVLRDHGMSPIFAHNDWIEWADEGGLPFMLFMLIPALWGSWQSLRYPWGMGVIAVSLHAAVDFPFQRYCTLLCFFLIIATMLACNQSATTEADRTV